MIYATPEFDATILNMIKSPDGKKGYRHSCYEECCDHAEEMSWHIFGTKPEKLLTRVRPREDPDVTTYRLENYEPTTKAAADKAIAITSKIFNPNLSSIRWKDENADSKVLQDYTMENFPVYNSVVNYAKEVLLRKMLADPNGVVSIKLQDIPEKQNEELNPLIVIYGSDNIWNYDSDHYLIFIKSTEEKASSGGIIKWFYFEYFDKNQYMGFRVYLTSTDSLVFEEQETYAYNFGEIPVWKLQGLSESLNNGEVIYKSFFASAVPYWNLSIIHESDVLGAYINHMHPLRVEISEICDHKWEGRLACRAGLITKEDGEKFSCPSCSGSGYRNMGPYGVFKISKEKLQEGDTPISQPAIQYVTVPVDATKMLEERAARMQQKGMWAINMDVEDEIGQVQSGVAKVIDRSAQYDTLYNIGSVIFDVHLENIFHFFNKFMFGVSSDSTGKESETNLPEINKPTQFDIGSTTEMINNFSVAKTAGLDPNLLQIKQQEILSVDFTTNPDLKTFAFLIMELDPLPGMDAQTVSLNVSRLFVRQLDAVIHNNIKRFVERAMEEDESFPQKPQKEQIAKLEEYGKEFVTQNKPVIDPTLMNYAQQNKKIPQTQTAGG
jgi:hypothetical protein